MTDVMCCGYNFIRGIADNKGSALNVCDAILWKPFYSLVQKENTDHKLFTEKLSATKAEYFILDLYGLGQYVSVENGLYSAKKDGCFSTCLFEKREVVKQTLDLLIKILLTRFSPDKIILICSQRATAIAKGQLVLSASRDTLFESLMDEYEKYFIAQCGCFYINLNKNYYADYYCRYGFSLVNYEASFYQDIISKITFISQNSNGKDSCEKTYDCPSLRFILDKYKKIRQTFMEKTPTRSAF